MIPYTLLTIRKPMLLSLLTTLTLYASNGDLMIATGTKSMGMGGVGIALSFGAESGLANPALLSDVKESEISGSATFFFPSIKTQADPLFVPSSKNGHAYESDASFYLIPSLSYATALEQNWYVGMGVWGIAGMGVDFSDAPVGSGLFGMQTNLMIMHIATPIAYQSGALSLGIAPIVQVGMLDIQLQNLHPYDKTWDANMGLKLGVVYHFENGLKVGGVYQTPISMEYHANTPWVENLKLEQPQEYGVGFSWQSGVHTVAMDYKRINWNTAEGYKNFGWNAQNLFAVGYEYHIERGALRVGYNYAKSPIDTTKAQPLQNYLNLLGFPATSKEHYTLGGSYSIAKHYTMDFATVYSPEETTNGVIYDKREIEITNQHKELSVTLQFDYHF